MFIHGCTKPLSTKIPQIQSNRRNNWQLTSLKPKQHFLTFNWECHSLVTSQNMQT